MIRITFEEAAAFAQPNGLSTREAALFWRATRLVRRAATNGGDPDALIADAPGDLLPGSEYLAQVGLEGHSAEELLDRASRVRYTLRLHCYEVDLASPRVIALLPRDVLTEELKAALRLGHAPVTIIPHTALREELDALRANGTRVQWYRVRLCADSDPPQFELRMRVRGATSRELRTRLPHTAFPNADAVTAFIHESVGEGACLV